MMKMPRLFVAAGLVVAALGVSTSANAQRYDNNPQIDQRDHSGDRRDNGANRRDDNGRRYDNARRDYRGDRGRRYGWNHRRCWTEWRHHHRVRRCR
jgi:hypothetical protein